MGNSKKKVIGLVYEISNNPYFDSTRIGFNEGLSEFVSPLEINRVLKALENLNYSIEIIDGPADILKRSAILKKKCTLLFNKSIGFKGLERKIQVPALCQFFGIPYVGTSAYGLTLTRHKYHTNRLLNGLGFKVPHAYIFYPGETINISHLDMPVIIKPNHESDSLGITQDSLFNSTNDIENAIKRLHQNFQQPVIVEEFISGEEWKVAVIGNRHNTKSFGCIGVDKNGGKMNDTFQTREDVLGDNLNYYLPLTSNLVLEALKCSKEIFNALELQDYGRCDFRIGKNGVLYCMEVSTHPCITEGSSFIFSALQYFQNYENIIQSIIESALLRYGI